MNIDQIMNTLTEFVTTYGIRMVGGIVTLIIGFWVIGRIAKWLRGYFKRADYDETLEPFILSIVSVGLKILLILAVASMLGIETASFIAVFGALAFAIGLALQGSLSHFASGVLILIFRPYEVGDFITAAGHSGTVRELQIFNTILTTLDNRKVIIPNGNVLSGTIENFTAPDLRQVDMTFGIGYSDDIDKAKQVLEDTLNNAPNVLHDRGHTIVVKELADSSVNFAVRCWCNTSDYWGIFFFMQENVKKNFDREGINIPFPQMDVHVNQAN